MVASIGKLLMAGWVVLGALGAQAQEFSVGRVGVVFADGDWKEVPLPDAKHHYKGEKGGALNVQSRLYVRDAGSDTQVLVLVKAASNGLAGRSYMTYSGECATDQDNYREGTLRHTSRQCMVVTPLYTSESVFKALAPEVLGLSEDAALALQRPVYTVWNSYAISTGTFVDVRVFVTAPIEGPAVTATLPQGVPAAHVAWGRQLVDAVRSSAHSLSGRLVMPAIRVPPPPPPPPSAPTRAA